MKNIGKLGLTIGKIFDQQTVRTRVMWKKKEPLALICWYHLIYEKGKNNHSFQ
jgi:hypothetical protein